MLSSLKAISKSFPCVPFMIPKKLGMIIFLFSVRKLAEALASFLCFSSYLFGKEGREKWDEGVGRGISP